MKTYFTLLLFLTALHLHAQLLHDNASSRFMDCEQGNATLEIKSKNTLSTLKMGGNFISDYTSPIHSTKKLPLLSSASIWISGKTKEGNLKLAAGKPKTNESDFFPGPLKNKDGETSMMTCEVWDQVFTITKEEIEKHIRNYEKYGQDYNCDSIPDAIKYWPGQYNSFAIEKLGSSFFDQNYGIYEFIDADADGRYTPCQGDYPSLPITNCYFSARPLKIPSRLSLFRMNSSGGLHNVTGGTPLKAAVDVFQWSFDNDLTGQNATYYALKIYNYSEVDLLDSYMGLILDPNMGCALDDKVGIYTPENLIFMYNDKIRDGQNQCADAQSLNYYPYMTGLKFTKLPRTPKVFERDQNGNLVYDDEGNKKLKDPAIGSGDIDTLIRINISKFWVNEACNSVSNLDCDALSPNDASYYNIIKGNYKDGSPRLKDGKVVDYMYDGLPSDPTSWNMLSDRHFEGKDIKCGISFGPMHLQPGAINQINFVVFQSSMESVPPSLGPLFNDCQYLNSENDCLIAEWQKPLPPDLTFDDSDTDFKIEIIRDPSKENQVEIVKAKSALPEEKNFDLTANFEGYVLYQLKDPYVTDAELAALDSTKVKRIYVTDIQNNVDKVYDYLPFSAPTFYNLGRYVWKPILKVNGPNFGIEPSFTFIKDLFNPSSPILKGKQYYFASQTYMYNNWKEVDSLAGYGQRNQFIASNLLKHSHIYKSITSTSEATQQALKVDCSNGHLKFWNTQDDNYNVYSIDGKFITSINTQGKEGYLYKLQVPNNSILVVQESNTANRRVQKVFCH